MFKKLSIIFLIVFLNITFAPKVQAYIFISVDQANQIGDQYARQVESTTGVVEDSPFNPVINDITNRLLATMQGVNIPFQVKILNTSELNSFSVPGGHVFINYGICMFVKNYDELAFIVGHEMGHNVKQHYEREVEQQSKQQVLISILVPQSTQYKYGNLINLLLQNQNLGYSRQMEMEADQYGFERIAAANYNIGAGAIFFHTMLVQYGDGGGGDHPSNSERLNNQLKDIKLYSNNHVSVVGDKLYIDGKYIMTPSATEDYVETNGQKGYDSYDRAYILASNLAKAYHHNPVVIFSKSDNGQILANGSMVIVPNVRDENIDIIFNRQILSIRPHSEHFPNHNRVQTDELSYSIPIGSV